MTYVKNPLFCRHFDHLWREHLVNLDTSVRSSVSAAYAQRDPLQNIKSKRLKLFSGSAWPIAAKPSWHKLIAGRDLSATPRQHQSPNLPEANRRPIWTPPLGEDEFKPGWTHEVRLCRRSSWKTATRKE